MKLTKKIVDSLEYGEHIKKRAYTFHENRSMVRCFSKFLKSKLTQIESKNFLGTFRNANKNNIISYEYECIVEINSSLDKRLPSLYKEFKEISKTRRQQGIKIYEKLSKIVSPVLEYYKEDLTKYDKQVLLANGEIEFLYSYHNAGTDMFILENNYLTENTIKVYADRSKKFLHYKNREFKHITRAKFVEILNETSRYEERKAS